MAGVQKGNPYDFILFLADKYIITDHFRISCLLRFGKGYIEHVCRLIVVKVDGFFSSKELPLKVVLVVDVLRLFFPYNFLFRHDTYH